MTHQYFSKWRNEWIDFSPTEGELIQMKKYKYEIKIMGQSSRLPVSTATIKSGSQPEAIKAFYEAYPKMANNDDFYLEVSEVAK